MIYSEVQKEIRDICFRLLTRREHSQLELLDKLALRGFDRLGIQIILDELADEGWQSEQRFAESYARHRIKKGYGPIRIDYELRQRGIEAIDLNAVLIDMDENWDEILQSIYEKKYANDIQLTNKEWLKRCQFLVQRGFSREMINLLFKRLNIQLIY